MYLLIQVGKCDLEKVQRLLPVLANWLNYYGFISKIRKKASQISHLSTSTKVGWVARRRQHFLPRVSQFCHSPLRNRSHYLLLFPATMKLSVSIATIVATSFFCTVGSLATQGHLRGNDALSMSMPPTDLAEWAAFDSTSMSMMNAQGDFGAFVPEDSAVTALAKGSGKAGKYMTTSTSSTVVTKAGKSGRQVLQDYHIHIYSGGHNHNSLHQYWSSVH